MGPFWLPFGPSWAPKLAPKWLLGHDFSKKCDFSNFERHCRENRFCDLWRAPKTPQDRPKTPPRRSSRGTFLMFDFVFDFGPFLVPFCLHFGSPNRSFLGSIFALFLDVAPRAPQEAPKGSPGANLGAKSCHFGAQEAILGGKNHQKPLVFLVFREKTRFFQTRTKRVTRSTAVVSGVLLSNSNGAFRFQLLRFGTRLGSQKSSKSL